MNSSGLVDPHLEKPYGRQGVRFFCLDLQDLYLCAAMTSLLLSHVSGQCQKAITILVWSKR